MSDLMSLSLRESIQQAVDAVLIEAGLPPGAIQVRRNLNPRIEADFFLAPLARSYGRDPWQIAEFVASRLRGE